MSNAVTLKFIKAGMYTTIQDLGRPGHQDIGIPFGGALDKTAFQVANALVGNREGEPALEITMTGPEVEFSEACTIAITGADIQPQISGVGVERYQRMEIGSGSVLSFGHLEDGCRAYLSVAGHWQVSRWLESASALRVGSTDLVPGAILRKGSQLQVMPTMNSSTNLAESVVIPTWTGTQEIRVYPGPELQMFTGEQIAYFFNTEFALTTDSNRIGCRLEPELPNFIHDTGFISSGIVPGTIQVARQGQAVILLADAQTTGGYPRIANVSSDDLDVLGQLKPGSRVRFKILRRDR